MNIQQEPTIAQQNGIIYQIRQKYGIACDTDSYKLSHHPQYRAGVKRMVSYVEARGGPYDKVLNFGLEMLCQEYLLQRLTKQQVENMVAWAKEHMVGNQSDDLEIALNKVVDLYGGKLPIRIRNAKEGLMIPVGNVIATIETTVDDNEIFSLVSYFETKLLRIWSPMTLGTKSMVIRDIILKALKRSSDDPMGEIRYKLHDFGSRGGDSMEEVAFSGAAHLIPFSGTDSLVAVMAVEFAHDERMAATSIPASEHGTTTTNENEIQLVEKMFDAYAKPGAIFATVIDSYDTLAFIRKICPLFKDRLIESGATWVLRPDSGDSVKMPIKVVQELEKVFGTTENTRGFKVLNHVRVIQGDGIDVEEVRAIEDGLMALGYSASNMAFGMGGALHGKKDRDTCKFSMKCCAVLTDDDEWVDVFKDPAVYDEKWNMLNVKSFKTSKKGRVELMYNTQTGEFATMTLENANEYTGLVSYGWEKALEIVFEDGYMVRRTPFSEIRKNAGV